MAIKNTKLKWEPVKPVGPIRYFKHKETGRIHEADSVWAPIMKNRSDLVEVEQEGNPDEKTD